MKAVRVNQVKHIILCLAHGESSIHGWLAMKERNITHTQPKHPMRRGRAAGNKNVANWREMKQSRTAGSPAQLPKA